MFTGRCSTVFFCQWRVSCGILFRTGLLVLLASTLTGCGEPKTPEQIVAERAQARWDALLAGDFETAYSFASPAYRSIVDAIGFQRRFGGGQVGWLGATVRQVECRDDVCEATVRIKFASLLPPRMSDLETDDIERWVLDEGDWWIFLKP